MRSIILAMGVLIVFIITLPIYIVVRITNNEKLGWMYIRMLVKTINFFVGNKLTIVGQENLLTDQAFLVVSNHDSIFDIPNILSAMKKQPIGFVAKDSLANIPLISWLMYMAKSEFIDRENIRMQVKSISSATKTLKAGHNMAIFPEGTRSEENMEFKTGSFKIAQKAQKAVQPITIVNSAALFEKTGKFHSAKTFVIVHEPILFEDYKERSLAEVAHECETLIHTTKDEYFAKYINK